MKIVRTICKCYAYGMGFLAVGFFVVLLPILFLTAAIIGPEAFTMHFDSLIGARAMFRLVLALCGLAILAVVAATQMEA